jgi:uncharacterized membrane protein
MRGEKVESSVVAVRVPYEISMERILAGLLRYGAIMTSVCIAIGLVLNWTLAKTGSPSSNNDSLKLIEIGVGTLISLPVLRVALMMGIFIKQKDYRFAAISAVVLGIVASGFAWGVIHVGGSTW